MIWNQLVATLRGQNVSRDDHGSRAEQTDAPAHGAENPRLIKLPANKEPVLVVEQICLETSQHPHSEFWV